MDTDGDGICDSQEVGGCTDELACNYDASATDGTARAPSADARRLRPTSKATAWCRAHVVHTSGDWLV